MSEPSAWLMTLPTPRNTLVTIATARREDVQNAERSGRLVTCEALCKESMLAAATLRAEAAEAERDRLTRILAALREPSKSVSNVVWTEWHWGTTPDGLLRAAVTAAEHEVGP